MHNIDALLILLEDERQLILAGDFRALSKLSEAKSEIFAHVRQNALTHGQLSQLQSMTDRNQSLLTAAANGIRSARDRLQAIRNPGQDVKTYTRRGDAQVLSRAHPSFERRA